MFWDAKKISYKILFRDGSDAWVTGEAIDKALDAKEQYPAAVKVAAALEKWDCDAVGTTLIGYGLYCAKHVGPTSSEQSTSTASLDREAVYPQRYPLVPRQEVLMSGSGFTVQPAKEFTTTNVTTRENILMMTKPIPFLTSQHTEPICFLHRPP